MKASPDAAANPELLEVLSRAAARADADSGAHGVPVHIRCAQAMLEMAVEWRLPDVERWAVAWLMAAGGGQLRMRWSSRSRDGRFRQEARASASIVSIAEAGGHVLLGLKTGAVESWAEDGTMHPLLPENGSPVWSVAARGDRLVAVGPGNGCRTSGRPSPPPITRPKAGLTAVAIGSRGHVAVGTEDGYLRTWAPGRREWDQPKFGISKPVVAISYAGSGSALIRAVWESGEVAELDRANGTWRLLHRFPDGVRAAAWTRTGTMLAAAMGEEFWLVIPGEGGQFAARLLWPQAGVMAVAWSPDNVLASAGRDQICASTGRAWSPGEVDVQVDSDRRTRREDHPARRRARGQRAGQSPGPVGTRQRGQRRSDVLRWRPHYRARHPASRPARHAGGYRPRPTERVQRDRGDRPRRGATGRIQGHADRMAQRRQELAGGHSRRHVPVPARRGPGAHRQGLPPVRGRRRRAFRLRDGQPRHHLGRRDLHTAGPVADLHADPRGTLAVLDEEGNIRVQRPGEEAVAGTGQKQGTRLLGNDAASLLVQDFDGRIRLLSPQGSLSFGRLPADLLGAARFDRERIVIAYEDDGILLASAGPADHSWVPDRVRVMTVNAGRIAVGTPNHVAGYDVLGAGGEAADGTIPLYVRSVRSGYQVQMPTGEPINLTGEEVTARGDGDAEGPGGKAGHGDGPLRGRVPGGAGRRPALARRARPGHRSRPRAGPQLSGTHGMALPGR